LSKQDCCKTHLINLGSLIICVGSKKAIQQQAAYRSKKYEFHANCQRTNYRFEIDILP